MVGSGTFFAVYIRAVHLKIQPAVRLAVRRAMQPALQPDVFPLPNHGAQSASLLTLDPGSLSWRSVRVVLDEVCLRLLCGFLPVHGWSASCAASCFLQPAAQPAQSAVQSAVQPAGAASCTASFRFRSVGKRQRGSGSLEEIAVPGRSRLSRLARTVGRAVARGRSSRIAQIFEGIRTVIFFIFLFLEIGSLSAAVEQGQRATNTAVQTRRTLAESVLSGQALTQPDDLSTPSGRGCPMFFSDGRSVVET